jgi:hypothetical protein
MLNADQQSQNPSRNAPPQGLATHRLSLKAWVHQIIGHSQARIKMRLRGNTLHILCESAPCLEASVVMANLQQAIAATPLEKVLPADPPIYRILIYGRTLGEATPVWTKAIQLEESQLEESQRAESKPQQQAEVRQEAAARQQAARQKAEDGEQAAQGKGQRTGGNRREGAVALLELAEAENPEAIARYLSEVFSSMGVSIRAKIETVALKPNPFAANSPLSARALPPRRLLIACESVYTPDAALLAEPIAQHLRELNLAGFQDALVFGQVRGETRPEWKLRVDLTSPDEILKEWGRWGDVQAITQLLNRALANDQIQLSALLKETTLHLSCFGSQQDSSHSSLPDQGLPNQARAIAIITPWLQSLSPQGIQSAAVYGVAKNKAGKKRGGKDKLANLQASTDSSAPTSDTPTSDAPNLHTPDSDTPDSDTPAWVHWLELSAKTHPELASTALDLAREGNLDALTFLLTRLLNPDLHLKLATGGIRVQIRQKSDLLHIMTDALNCPRQDVIAAELVRFLKPLHLPFVSGIRVYGRRSGQKQPLWNYGVDFAMRQRLVPEATPEFAASDIHVDELLSPSGAIVPWIESPTNEDAVGLERGFGKLLAKLQRSLIQTQVFIPSETSPNPALSLNTATNPAIAPNHRQQAGIALIWSTIGILLVLQADWVIGQWLHLSTPQRSTASLTQSAPTPQTPSSSPFPNVTLNKSRAQNWQPPRSTGFTQPGTTEFLATKPANGADPSGATPLVSSPLQAKANSAIADYPSFNSRQLDNQIAVYRQYLEANGAPDVLVIGSSRALRGIDPMALKAALTEQGYAGVKVFNFGVNGATAQVVDWLVRDVLPQDKLPKLLIFADGARAFNSGRQDITYRGVAASEGYRTLVAGKPPIPGALAQATGESKPETGSSTPDGASSIANGYEQVNRALNTRLAGVSALYAQRDRLRTKLVETLSAWVPSGLNSSDVIASSDTLLNSSSPAAAAATGADSLASDGQGMVDINGFLPLNLRFNPVTYYQKYARVSGDYDSDYEAFILQGAQIDALKSLNQFSRERKIPFVFVNLPLTKEYLDPTRKRHEETFQQQMLQLASQNGFIFRDLSGALTTQPDYFSDPSHLNRYGAYNTSHRIAQDVMIPWQMTK